MIELVNNPGMDMYQHRRARLLALIDADYGGERVRFCDRTGLSESRLAQLLSTTYRDGTAFTEKTARKVEILAGLSPMYFDQETPLPIVVVNDAADDHPLFSRRVRAGEEPNTVSIKRVKLRVSAGVTGFETEPDHEDGGVLQVPIPIIQQLKLVPHCLLALQVKGPSMEPMLFEDDWIVVNIADTRPVSREVYAINFDGEACIKQLVKRGMDWYMHSLNPDFGPVNIRSGQFDIVGKFVWQPGRVVTGRL